MKYRKIGGESVSQLGMGAMRLPESNGRIDEARAIEMLRYGLDHGVNYIDTAYVYHGGNSELVVGKALRDGYRAKTNIATKLPVWNVREPADFDRLLNEQLAKLQTDHIDFYLLHSLGRGAWNDKVVKFDLVSKMDRAKKDGRIRHMGFSFHDNLDAFKLIIDGCDHWDFAQVQYSYMDGRENTDEIEYAAAHGVSVIAMEPIRGGKLVNAPQGALDVMNSYRVKLNPVRWALDYVWNRPEIAVVLSGMTTLEQLKENLIYADEAGANTFTPEDFELLERVKVAYEAARPVPCTNCNYCMPCPFGVKIPDCFNVYNDTFAFGLESSKGGYNWIGKDHNASNCTACRQCEEKCPQHIVISELMPQVDARLR